MSAAENGNVLRLHLCLHLVLDEGRRKGGEVSLPPAFRSIVSDYLLGLCPDLIHRESRANRSGASKPACVDALPVDTVDERREQESNVMKYGKLFSNT
ncbi:hypothetical protein Q1M64_25945 [Sinorhizobium meliloti]|nr:hypothetical protein Q1M64_25945 [Sinorhizobium meliloti]